jgi:riboflavin synthase
VPSAEGVVVRVAIIPHTYAVTHLHGLAPGAKLNVETDVLAKYAAKRPAAARAIELEYLIRSGY